jgi:hypothetical protein
MAILGMFLRAVVAFGAIYLLGAFAAWDLNAGNWETADRFVVALFGGLAAIMAAILPTIK